MLPLLLLASLIYVCHTENIVSISDLETAVFNITIQDCTALGSRNYTGCRTDIIEKYSTVFIINAGLARTVGVGVNLLILFSIP